MLLRAVMTVIKHFEVAFSNNCIGCKLMRVKYICATAAKILICSAAEISHIFNIIEFQTSHTHKKAVKSNGRGKTHTNKPLTSHIK